MPNYTDPWRISPPALAAVCRLFDNFKDKPVSIISSSWAFTGGVRAQYQLRETLISLQAHLVMGPEVVVGGVHTKLADNTYTDGNGLAFMLTSLARLREEILGRRLVGVQQWRSRAESLQWLVAKLLSANECLREILHNREPVIEQNSLRTRYELAPR
jgi:hypothetical protein